MEELNEGIYISNFDAESKACMMLGDALSTESSLIQYCAQKKAFRDMSIRLVMKEVFPKVSEQMTEGISRAFYGAMSTVEAKREVVASIAVPHTKRGEGHQPSAREQFMTSMKKRPMGHATDNINRALMRTGKLEVLALEDEEDNSETERTNVATSGIFQNSHSPAPGENVSESISLSNFTSTTQTTIKTDYKSIRMKNERFETASGALSLRSAATIGSAKLGAVERHGALDRSASNANESSASSASTKSDYLLALPKLESPSQLFTFIKDKSNCATIDQQNLSILRSLDEECRNVDVSFAFLIDT